jgi:hypothetical protein
MVTRLQVDNAFSHLGNDCGCFVSESHREWPWTVPVDDGEIGMTQAGRRYPDEHFADAWSLQIDGLDGERLAVGVSGFGARGIQHSGFDFHGASNAGFRIAVTWLFDAFRNAPR